MTRLYILTLLGEALDIGTSKSGRQSVQALEEYEAKLENIICK